MTSGSDVDASFGISALRPDCDGVDVAAQYGRHSSSDSHHQPTSSSRALSEFALSRMAKLGQQIMSTSGGSGHRGSEKVPVTDKRDVRML
jgi:hypothetical protein